MKYNTTRLLNGLRIIHLPSASPVVYCGYEVNAGSASEEPIEGGLLISASTLPLKEHNGEIV